MAEAGRSFPEERKEIHAFARRACQATPQSAVGKGRKEICVRGAKWPGNFGGVIRGQKPATGLSFHVCAGLGGGMQGMLAAGRRIRARYRASQSARRDDAGGIAG